MRTPANGPYNEMFTRAFENLMDSGASDNVLEAAQRAYEETEVYTSNRMTRAAGLAKYTYNRLTREVSNLKIGFSIKLFARIDDAEKFNVVSHEFAHIVDAILRGRSNHDHAWKRIHRMMGGNGKVYHDYDTSGLGRVMTYVCVIDEREDSGYEYRVTRQKWNKIKWMPSLRAVAQEKRQGGRGGNLVERIPIVSARSAANGKRG